MQEDDALRAAMYRFEDELGVTGTELYNKVADHMDLDRDAAACRGRW